MKKYKLADLVENFSVRAKNVGGSEGLEFLGVSNEDGITKSKYAAEDKAEDYKIIEKGCFAYNPYRINVGSIAYVNDDIRGLISPAYVIFKTKPNMVDDRLLLKFLKSAEGLRQIKINARGSVRQALRFEDLCKIEINLPEYEKQVEFLDKIDIIDFCSNDVSTEITHQLDLIKNLRQAFLCEAMQGLLVSNETSDNKTGADLLAEIQAEKAQLVKEKKIKKPKPLAPITNEEIPFAIPENWTWCRLGEIIKDFLSGNAFKSQLYSKEETNNFVIRLGNVKNNIVDEYLKPAFIDDEYAKDSQKYLLEKDDVLITMTGTRGKKDYLYTSIVGDKGKNKLFLNQRVGCLRFISSNVIYLNYLLKLDFILNPIFDSSTGAANQANIGVDAINNAIIPLPPLEIQERIVAKLDELMGYCDALEEQVKQSQQTNELLLQQVLREALGA